MLRRAWSAARGTETCRSLCGRKRTAAVRMAKVIAACAAAKPASSARRSPGPRRSRRLRPWRDATSRGSSIPCVEAVGRLARGALAFAALYRRQDRGGGAGGDLVLHRKNIGEVAVIALGPEMPAGRRLDQLRGHPHSIAGLAHAAFKHVAHAQLAPDLFHVDRAALEGEARVARDDEQRA